MTIHAERYVFCPPFMDFTRGYSDKDLQFFYVSNADFYDIWYVESWDFKFCHDIGPPAGESREFSHKCVIFEGHSVRGTTF